MSATLTLLDLAGTVALLLWGVHMVQSGVMRAYGPDLRRRLGIALGNRFKAFAAGLGVTALLQSSTATGLMVASFTAGGLVELMPALAVMLGANVGTTLIVQIFSFDVARLSPLLVLIGVVVFRRATASRLRDLGRVAIGLGLMLTALGHLLAIITPYEAVPSLRILLGAIGTDPMIAVLFGALVAWVAHSSIATVLLIVSFATTGAVSLEAAMALVIGANLGAALNPVLEGARQGDISGRRVTVGNLLNRVVGCAIAIPLLGLAAPLLAGLEPDAGRAVADFHTLFNLALALLFFPFLEPIARLLRRLMPRRVDPTDYASAACLDYAAVEMPPIALGSAARESLRMVDVLDAMLRRASEAADRGERGGTAEIRQMEEVLDRLSIGIESYLAAIEVDAMNDADERRMAAILSFAANLEHAGDAVHRHIMPLAARRLKLGLAFSHDDQAELRGMFERLRSNLKAASAVYMTEDERAARLVADEKVVFRDLVSRATAAHFRGLRQRSLAARETSALYLDLVQALKRVNDHLVASAAYTILDRSGELMNSRVRPVEPAGVLPAPGGK